MAGRFATMDSMVNVQAQSSPAATAELGRRALAHLNCLMRTRPANTAGGPTEMYKVIGSCAQIADIMQPSLTILGDLLVDYQARGQLSVRLGPFVDDAPAAIIVTKQALSDAVVACNDLYEALERAQLATAHIAASNCRSARPERQRKRISRLLTSGLWPKSRNH